MFNLAAISAEVSNGAEYISFLRALRRGGGDCAVSLRSHRQDFSVARLIGTVNVTDILCVVRICCFYVYVCVLAEHQYVFLCQPSQ